jgi:hypothetical protein
LARGFYLVLSAGQVKGWLIAEPVFMEQHFPYFSSWKRNFWRF